MNLIGRFHRRIKFFLGNIDQTRMGHPSAIVPVAGFPAFVGAHFSECLLVGRRIVFDRNLRRHAANRRAPRRWQVLIANSE